MTQRRIPALNISGNLWSYSRKQGARSAGRLHWDADDDALPGSLAVLEWSGGLLSWLYFLMLRVLFFSFLTLLPLAAAPSVLRALPTVAVTPYLPPTEQVQRFLKTPLQDDYGIYSVPGNEKLGWMSFTMEMATVEGTRVVRVVEVNEFSYKLEKVAFLQQSRQELLFDATPPYALRKAHLTETLQKAQRSTVLTRTGAGEYRAVIIEQGEARVRTFSNLQWTALDRLGPRIWATGSQRQRGDAQAFRAFDLKTLEPYSERYCLQSAASEGDLIQVESEDLKAHFKTLWKLRLSGEVESMVIAGTTVLRRQTRTEARQPEAAPDLLTQSFLPCHRALGPDNRKIPALEARLRGADFSGVVSTAQQKVALSLTGDAAIIRTGPNAAPPTPATSAEMQLNLRANVAVPSDDARIIKLAQRATGRASSATAKVRALLQFVSDYLTDDDREKPLSVYDLLENPRGDCTAHVLLFTCLARASGIPCREASGYIYLGDRVQSFGGHAWNEVVLDGVWHPVDPTWNEFTLDGTHLQLSTGHPTPRDGKFFNGKVEITVNP